MNYNIYNIKRFKMISLKKTSCRFAGARYLHWCTQTHTDTDTHDYHNSSIMLKIGPFILCILHV